jgi:hypothetical protein
MKTVKCISAIGCATGLLQEGKIYQVVQEGKGGYILKDVATPFGYWDKIRFVEVSETVSAIKAFKSIKESEDPEEDRLRKLLMPRIAADECCGGVCKKAQCWIHKDQ